MKFLKLYAVLLLMATLAGCGTSTPSQESAESQEDATTATTEQDGDFEYLAEQFADLKLIRYRIPGFDRLTTDQKALVYYLTQAGLAGRDIMYDQNYRHNLEIRKALENVVRNYDGDKNAADWENFMTYVKRMWFSNGIHHHYSNNKLTPEFSRDYLNTLLSKTGTTLGD